MKWFLTTAIATSLASLLGFFIFRALRGKFKSDSAAINFSEWLVLAVIFGTMLTLTIIFS